MQPAMQIVREHELLYLIVHVTAKSYFILLSRLKYNFVTINLCLFLQMSYLSLANIFSKLGFILF